MISKLNTFLIWKDDSLPNIAWILLIIYTLSRVEPVNPKGNQSWIFIGRTDAEADVPILWPPDARADSLEKTLIWERLKAWGEGDDRGWNGWMASPTRWTWIWVSSMSWWWTGKPGVLQSMGLPRVRHNSVTELNWRIFYICDYITRG